jgi:hypothetical protein
MMKNNSRVIPQPRVLFAVWLVVVGVVITVDAKHHHYVTTSTHSPMKQYSDITSSNASNVPTTSPNTTVTPVAPPSLPSISPTVHNNSTHRPVATNAPNTQKPTMTPTTSPPPHSMKSDPPVTTQAPASEPPVVPPTTAVPIPAPTTPPIAPVVTAVPVVAPPTITTAVPTPTHVVVPVAPPSPTAVPTASSNNKNPTRRHVSLVQIIAKTMAWLILIFLSVVAFGACMSHRYRIYYFLRGCYYTILRLDCTIWMVSKLRQLPFVSNNNNSDYSVNTVIFDNDMNEGLLMRENEYD